MAIINFDFNSAGQSGENPAILYLATTDTVAEVTAAGYINGIVGSKLPVAVGDMVLVNTQATPTSDQAVAWYGVGKSGSDYILIPANSPFPTVTVPFGGTGLTSLVPYAILAGGTTSTGPMQQISGLGSAGQVLTSSGAGALPVWGAAGGSGAPSSASYITQIPEGGLSNEQALSLLATGIVKNTTTTGVLSIAAQGVDYYAPGGTDVAVADGGTGSSTAAGARTNLGLVIGTDVQAWDAGLDSISGLTTSAGTMLYTTASDTYATTPSTAFGRSLLNLADAAAGRTTLGLGTIATQDANNVTITGGSIILSTPLGVASGGTGNSSLTAYAIMAGGTTSTGAMQQVSGVGTAGQVLTSSGAGALPVWGAATAGGTVTSVSGTTNRITVTSPTTTPVIDIAATYVGQSSITTLGTIGTGVWAGTAITLANSGTGAALTAVNGGIVWSNASTLAISAAGSAGQVLLSGGAGAPTWSTPTFPATVGAVGTILRSDGTNYVATTATFANTYTASNLLYSNGANTVTGLATGNNGVLITSGAGVPSISSTLPAVVQGNITALGTIATGVWNGTAITVPYGGTGATSFTAYAPVIGGTTSTAALASAATGMSTVGYILTSTGSSSAPTWQANTGGSGGPFFKILVTFGNPNSTIVYSSNVASVVYIGPGNNWTINFTSATSSANFYVTCCCKSTIGANDFTVDSTATTSMNVTISGGATWYIMGFA